MRSRRRRLGVSSAGSAVAFVVAISGATSGHALLAPPPADYIVHRIESASVRLDGADPAWNRAEVVEWGPSPWATRFRALWSGAGLHLRFDADDDAPWATMTGRDAALWEEEVVEIFFDPGGDGRYIEIELSPANVVCDLRRIAPGTPPRDPIPVPGGIMDRGFDVAGIETRVERRRDAWVGTLFFPWRGVGLAETPEPGTRMRFNLFRVKRPGGPEAPQERAVFAAWSPTGSPSFHVPEAFRLLELAPSGS